MTFLAHAMTEWMEALDAWSFAHEWQEWSEEVEIELVNQELLTMEKEYAE